MPEKLGELLIKEGLITPLQLKEALRIQAQEGGQIGSILVKTGAITTEQLLNFLSKRSGVPAVDLEKINIPEESLKSIPIETIKRHHIIPLGFDEHSITIAMVDPTDLKVIDEVQLITGKKVNPVVGSSAQIEAALNCLNEGIPISAEKIREFINKKKSTGIIPIEVFLKYLVKSGASDMILVPGASPSIKIKNEIKRADMPPLKPDDSLFYARSITNESQWERFTLKGDLEFAITYPDIGRFRFNLIRQRGSVAITIRHIKDIIPGLDELGLPDILKTYLLKPQGFIIITGPSGHGKTTTMASMVDYINTKRRCNITTLERPIEYLHKHKNSNVIQREIGLDSESFSDALKSVFHQSADVIVIGELNDPETFDIALNAADSGHLVLTTMNASNTTSAVEKIINMFPPEKQNLIRAKIVDTLLLVLTQKLIKSAKDEGVVLAYEYLVNSYRIKNLIKEEKTLQIRSQYQSGSEDFYSIDLCLARLCREGKVKFEDALPMADNETMFRNLVERKG